MSDLHRFSSYLEHIKSRDLPPWAELKTTDSIAELSWTDPEWEETDFEYVLRVAEKGDGTLFLEGELKRKIDSDHFDAHYAQLNMANRRYNPDTDEPAALTEFKYRQLTEDLTAAFSENAEWNYDIHR
jgi:hypothetical protein